MEELNKKFTLTTKLLFKKINMNLEEFYNGLHEPYISDKEVINSI